MSRRFVRCFDSSFVTWSIDGDGVSSFFFFFFVQATSATSPPLLTSLGHSISHWSVPLSLLFIYLYWIFFFSFGFVCIVPLMWMRNCRRLESSSCHIEFISIELRVWFDSLIGCSLLCWWGSEPSKPIQTDCSQFPIRFQLTVRFGSSPGPAPLLHITLKPRPSALIVKSFQRKTTLNWVPWPWLRLNMIQT